ncbi:MAG: uroporphyrinogen-III C-methyltransferase [Chitinophagaceae bacterium]|nr:uroporphyrinogen-III C-methyltransferase [Chitinophagaceae bacterium]
MNKNFTYGKIIIAGAGPGDPDLITLKLQKALSQADAILVDRLANKEIWQRYAQKEAIILDVGKKAYSCSSTSQKEINELLIECAAKYSLTLRLKGGDISIYGNLTAELETLKAHQIPYELIPGITAASGIASYAAIPLTARGIAQSVRFVSLNPQTTIKEVVWRDWAATDDTLVFYMSLQNIHQLAESLLQYGANPEKPMALVLNGTTSAQKTIITTLEESSKKDFSIYQGMPGLVIIGKVAALHHQYKWVTEQEKLISIFDN